MVNSIVSIYASLLEGELKELDIPSGQRERIQRYIDFIKENAQLSQEPGKVPEQLEPHLIQKGEGKGLTGTVYHDGRLMPRTAANIAEKRRKTRGSIGKN